MSTTIREATADDAAVIWEFLEPFFADRLLLRRSEEEVQVLSKHGFVAFEADVCIGFAAVEIYSRKLAEIQCLAVSERFRNQGIGHELVRRCAMRARELGVMEVMAISSSERFLQSCGFDYALPDQKKALFYQLRPRE
ncbi:Amino-acid acetyltransferase [Rosistilla oblonga]|uniref:Amino-acid acetyltransferase n=1 Tax=Rosistilla oblonga TaxID=2527990 RepID=A0A518ITM8_9BACT|nr:GNAT family N-acetyltransferase [Rosistilla oblonga]QDV15300.1 Amino-acid acetyltransferase [Rosistilla oblonga]QDV56443.1 Amino-acid acetyltransferase [Rosistilla oblonga]